MPLLCAKQDSQLITPKLFKPTMPNEKVLCRKLCWAKLIAVCVLW